MNGGCYACQHCEIVRGKPLCNGFRKPFRLTEKQCTTTNGHCGNFKAKTERKEKMTRLIDLDDDRHTYCGDDGEYEKWNIDPDVPTVEAVSIEWIPVKERLPKEDGYYIVSCTQADISYSSTSDFLYDVDGDPQWLDEFGVVAWMPLPTPYERKEE